MKKQQLYKIFDEEYKQAILPVIEQFLARNSFTRPIYHMIDNFELCRFRGSMPLLFAQAFKREQRPFQFIGAASELIFATALVEDDIIDQDQARGKIPASHAKFGYPLTVASIGLAHTAVQGMIEELTDKLPETTRRRILVGFREAYQLLYESFAFEVTRRAEFWGELKEGRLPERLEYIHIAKTIQGTNALRCTGILLEDQVQGLADKLVAYSKELGVAGQIKNDIYDLTRYLGVDGISSDIRNGYVTVPILLYLNKLDPEERASFLEKFKDPTQATAVLIKLRDAQLIEDSIRLEQEYVVRAKKHVDIILPGSLPEIIESWADSNLVSTNESLDKILESRYDYRKTTNS